MPEHGPFPAGEPQVTSERELTARAAGPAADLRDRDERRTRQPGSEVSPGGQAGWAGAGELASARHVEVGDEELRIGAVEHDDLDRRVGLKSVHQAAAELGAVVKVCIPTYSDRRGLRRRH
jgi:hypothetical protein